MCFYHKLIFPVADVRKVDPNCQYVAHTGTTQEYNCSANEHFCETSKPFGGKIWTIVWHVLMHANSIMYRKQNKTTPHQQNHMAKNKTSCKLKSCETSCYLMPFNLFVLGLCLTMKCESTNSIVLSSGIGDSNVSLALIQSPWSCRKAVVHETPAEVCTWRSCVVRMEDFSHSRTA